MKKFSGAGCPQCSSAPTVRFEDVQIWVQAMYKSAVMAGSIKPNFLIFYLLIESRSFQIWLRDQNLQPQK